MASVLLVALELFMQFNIYILSFLTFKSSFYKSSLLTVEHIATIIMQLCYYVITFILQMANCNSRMLSVDNLPRAAKSELFPMCGHLDLNKS